MHAGRAEMGEMGLHSTSITKQGWNPYHLGHINDHDYQLGGLMQAGGVERGLIYATH